MATLSKNGEIVHITPADREQLLKSIDARLTTVRLNFVPVDNLAHPLIHPWSDDSKTVGYILKAEYCQEPKNRPIAPMVLRNALRDALTPLGADTSALPSMDGGVWIGNRSLDTIFKATMQPILLTPEQIEERRDVSYITTGFDNGTLGKLATVLKEALGGERSARRG